MKTRLFQLEVVPGQPRKNTERMLAAIGEARAAGIDLIIFPEMAIPGYLVGDEWERSAFIKECEACTYEILQSTQNITVIFGNVAVDWNQKNEDGRPRKYNALFVAEDEKLLLNSRTQLPFFIKTLMPNYREFEDSRHFFDPRKLAYELGCQVDELVQPANSRLGKLGCALCEDGWDENYNISPLALLAEREADIFINISASPYTHNKNSKRNRVFTGHVMEHQIPLLYVNQVGLQDNGKTVFTFDGASCAYTNQGYIISELNRFEEGYLDTNPFRKNTVTSKTAVSPCNMTSLYDAIRYGTRLFMERMGIRKVVVGVSGGIDSAVVAGIYRQILTPDNLMLVSMPGPFTSATTRNLARKLAENLDCPFTEIPIADAVDLTRQQLEAARFERAGSASLSLEVSPFVLENIQARDRSSRILAACAAAFGGVFTCNANKSETTVGYSTLYGDLGGYFANIADLWKGEVYELANFLNDQVYGSETIPEGTIRLPPSAELNSAQNVDLGKGDPLFYPYHDALFRSWVERWERATPEDNLRWYCNGELEKQLDYPGQLTELFPTADVFIKDLERWWNLYQGMAIAKRIQAPPVLALKRRAFGFDHREAQLGARYTAAYEKLKAELLTG